MASLSLRTGSCGAALVAGVKLMLTPNLSAMFTRAGVCKELFLLSFLPAACLPVSHCFAGLA
jgi:hypothetical protein